MDFRSLDTALEPVLIEFSDRIAKLVDFGIEIWEWDLERPGITDEHLPPILFLRNFLEKIDAVSILMRHSSIDPCKNLLRTALENIASIEYLLEKDTEKRSLGFLVWNSVAQNKLATKADGQSAEYKNLVSKYKKDRLMKDHVPLIYPEADFIKSIGKQLLAHDKYRDIYVEYERTRQKTKNPAWYALYDGPENMDLLCGRLQFNALYEVLYRSLSQSVHGNDIIQGKLLEGEKGKTHIAHIRFPKDAQMITQQCFNFCILIFKSYIEKRIPKKLTEYNNWFKTVQEFNSRLAKENFVSFS